VFDTWASDVAKYIHAASASSDEFPFLARGLSWEGPMAAAEYIPEFVCRDDDRDLWLEERQKGIGASEAAMTMNISPFGNEWSLAQRKRSPAVELPWNELLAAGRYMETPMIEQFADETGWQCKRSGEMFRSTDPYTPFMTATMDGIVVRDDGKVGGLECKLVIYTVDQWESEGPPEHIFPQVQQQNRVMGYDFSYILALLAGYKFRHVLVENDREWTGDVLIPTEKTWWQKFLDVEAFDISKGDPRDAKDILGKLYPEDSGDEIDLDDPVMLEHWRAMELAKQQAKAANKTKEQHQLALKEAMGEATWATLENGQRLSLKTTKRSGFETKPTSFRTLRSVK
jgi:predicted phage-related endonuclease